jgi:hypothetical protein
MTSSEPTRLRIVGRSYGVALRADGSARRVTELETTDGRHWREALDPAALDTLDPGTLIFFGRGEPRPASAYAHTIMLIDGQAAAFLPALPEMGITVYVEQPCPVCGESPCEGYARGGHRVPVCWCGQPRGHPGQEQHE